MTSIPQPLIRYEFVTKTATDDSKLRSNHERAQFHCFNPNGIEARKTESDRLVREAVDAGRAKTGAIIAYGTSNNYYSKSLARLVTHKQIGTIDLHVTIRGIKHDIETAATFLSTLSRN
jgi:hypothetical protein